MNTKENKLKITSTEDISKIISDHILYLESLESLVDKGSIAKFSNLDLRGLKFVNLDLSNADFSNADLRGATFDNVTLKDANFYRSDLRGATLKKCDMQFASFARADLSGACVDSNIMKAFALDSAAFIGSVMKD